MLVAVLDHDPGVRAALERNLRKLGLAPRVVATPLDLLRCIAESAITIAILELAGARDVAAFLRSEYPAVRVVVSGTRFDELERCVSSQCAHAMLRKPWDQAELVRALGL